MSATPLARSPLSSCSLLAGLSTSQVALNRLSVCVPLYIFGLGLIVNFRQLGGYIDYIECFRYLGAAYRSRFCRPLTRCCGTSLIVRDRQAVIVALAICTNTFLKQLKQSLPESAITDIALIYEGLLAQLSYSVGSPTRYAIVKAYGYAQTRMLASGTAFMVLGFI
ncbi:siderochrome-iron transporter MirB [Penicillium canescens]|uniref:Siderochrome-iron transporter MirB n=1 Tax=Penicillium canescens TaxID=5083 RepID=A0AAD6NDU5_PENCN|nr:siderochrome-iron transporter MirB [Penicillium canescens]KAJ5990887.1 siderochrome-iron transporter MirB [Penicillium canescens]KAJ6049984.1 siderochrome-iron transporter MirB [Penicillium canescens]KAJ6052047.1 siderochrome-iron transporter MirB [Penicillium canescens]KAJ6062567.1 siderochrome-iron transporter MirB [Penicillium canescens]